ncbi:hypothetical protein [Azoarcus sp. KH32C]|uniref:hypothetical protein n=1 Tax=Azoarcus sp. KH32C TaxID=748247 RepID=UPI00023866F3|nr:hypothetical protein [Azoarcus sp. KH32C]BAL23693.1 hypothetical protein AZKH_1371 [Azoarcus sp. KH32C]
MSIITGIYTHTGNQWSGMARGEIDIPDMGRFSYETTATLYADGHRYAECLINKCILTERGFSFPPDEVYRLLEKQEPVLAGEFLESFIAFTQGKHDGLNAILTKVNASTFAEYAA